MLPETYPETQISTTYLTQPRLPFPSHAAPSRPALQNRTHPRLRKKKNNRRVRSLRYQTDHPSFQLPIREMSCVCRHRYEKGRTDRATTTRHLRDPATFVPPPRRAQKLQQKEGEVGNGRKERSFRPIPETLARKNLPASLPL